MKAVYLHPLPIRIWHWINASCMILLILSALQIRYVGIVDITSFHTAVVVHNWTGFVMIGNYFIWLLFYLNSDRRKTYHAPPPRKYFEGAFQQMQFYAYGIFVGDPNPFHVTPYEKFNPLQIVFYQIIMLLLLPVQFVTGLLLWDVKHFSKQVDFLGGVRVVDTVHVLIFIFFVFFIQIHIYLATLGHTPLAHIRAMFSGYEEFEEHGAAPSGADSAFKGDTSRL